MEHKETQEEQVVEQQQQQQQEDPHLAASTTEDLLEDYLEQQESPDDQNDITDPRTNQPEEPEIDPESEKTLFSHQKASLEAFEIAKQDRLRRLQEEEDARRKSLEDVAFSSTTGKVSKWKTLFEQSGPSITSSSSISSSNESIPRKSFSDVNAEEATDSVRSKLAKLLVAGNRSSLMGQPGGVSGSKKVVMTSQGLETIGSGGKNEEEEEVGDLAPSTEMNVDATDNAESMTEEVNALQPMASDSTLSDPISNNIITDIRAESIDSPPLPTAVVPLARLKSTTAKRPRKARLAKSNIHTSSSTSITTVDTCTAEEEGEESNTTVTPTLTDNTEQEKIEEGSEKNQQQQQPTSPLKEPTDQQEVSFQDRLNNLLTTTNSTSTDTLLGINPEEINKNLTVLRVTISEMTVSKKEQIVENTEQDVVDEQLEQQEKDEQEQVIENEGEPAEEEQEEQEQEGEVEGKASKAALPQDTQQQQQSPSAASSPKSPEEEPDFRKRLEKILSTGGVAGSPRLTVLKAQSGPDPVGGMGIPMSNLSKSMDGSSHGLQNAEQNADGVEGKQQQQQKQDKEGEEHGKKDGEEEEDENYSPSPVSEDMRKRFAANPLMRTDTVQDGKKLDNGCCIIL